MGDDPYPDRAGKTYCYIKTVFELYRRYGWGKFMVVVPSIAIREGVYKSLQMTAEHFLADYGRRARFFVYNSKQLHKIDGPAQGRGGQERLRAAVFQQHCPQ